MLNEDPFYEQYASICKTIVSPARLKIIEVIGDKRLNVSEIQAKLDISMSNLSNHLSALHRVGVLDRVKKGNFIYYFLTEAELLDALRKMRVVIHRIASTRNKMIMESDIIYC